MTTPGTSKLDVPLDSLVTQNQADSRGRGGGRMRGGKRYTRRDDASPYARRGGRNGAASYNNGAAAAAGNGTGGSPNRVYVGNLPWQTSWQDLKDHMRKAGNVLRADVFVDESGRSKGCGIVEYSAPEEAQNAIATLNDTKIDESDRLIFVREDREERAFAPPTARGSSRGMAPRGRGGFGNVRGGRGGFVASAPSTRGRQIFVGNLPYTTSWQCLKDMFRQAGNIIRADVLLDTTGRSKGQGTVLFESAQDAQKAIRMFNNTEFETRIITVHEDKFAQ